MKASSEKLKQKSILSRWLNREKKREKPKGIYPKPKNVKVPLSLGQQRLLFLQQLYPENPFYHYSDAYKIKGDLDLDKLLKSFEVIFQRHEILRTKVIFEGGKVFQETQEKILFEVSKHDLRDITEDKVENVAKEIAIKEARKSLDSPDGYLTRVSLLHLKDDEVLLILTFHHIVTDKWSMRVLRDELAENYRKLIDNKPVSFTPLEIQYSDYAYWQSLQKTNEKNLTYWKNKLEDSSGFLDLPTDFPRPNRSTFRGAYSTQKLPLALSKKLKAFCKGTNKTLFTVLLTAYKVLLKKYTGEDDILVGSPFTNRDEVKLEKLIGFFNDTLVLRSDLSKNPTFIELLEQVWKTSQEAFAHKNMPFETLVKVLQPDRYLNYNPLFQVMFIYHEVPKMPDFGEDLKIEQQPFDIGVTKFDLTLYISEDGDEITPIIEYSRDLFEEKTVQRMHGHLNELLGRIIENPSCRISELPVITDEEKDLISKWNDTYPEEIKENSVVEFFEEQVELNPKNIAVNFENQSLTYRELNKKANSIANYLLELNLDKNNPVGLMVEPSIEMIAGIWGILKAGFSYLPIDAEYPKERIKFILEDSKTKVLLTNINTSNFLQNERVSIQNLETIIASESNKTPVLSKEIEKKSLAYVIYTSGSTGKPKGVAITHENLFYSTKARFDFYDNNPESFLLLSSFSFDSSVAGIFWTLSTGGKLVLTKRRAEQDVDKLGEIFVQQKVTHTLLLPTLYSALIKNLPKEKFETFETIIVAGEACPKVLVKEHFENLSNVKLYNEYGPTEATVWATAHEIIPLDSRTNVPIGKPIPNVQIYILDEYKQLVPIGVTGEMYIGGKGVAKGYFNNSELTKKRFLSNPFSDLETNELYRTGDLCRYRNDGTIEFLGRKDNQIKLRGYRIELNDIEESIKQNQDVTDVVIKLENFQKENTKVEENSLLENLESLSIEEADELIKSVEKLSDKEIDFIFGEIE